MARRDSKIIRYRKPVNFNIGMVVFLIFFLYILINLISYLVRPHIQVYEVGAISSVVQDTTYTGLILREETVQTAPITGYVNVYIREGTRASVGDTVCLMDENGRYTELLKSGRTSSESSLTAVQLSNLKQKLATYSAGYRPVRFQEVYDIKYSLENQLLSYLTADVLNQIADVGVNITYLRMVDAPYSGVVEYYTDGMESLTEDKLTAADLQEGNYKRNAVTSGTMVEKGSPIYKSITSEKWVVYLPLTPEDQAALTDQSSVTLLFQDSSLEVKASFSLFTAADGTILGRCELSDFMVQLADKRYVSVSILKSRISSLHESGLKIPKTSLVSKEVFVVPRSYAGRGGNNGAVGFYRETVSAAGEKNAEFITASICARDDDYYYLDMKSIPPGTILKKPDDETAPTYIVGATITLEGVYNVNRGYALFRAVSILDKNDDYYIVASGQAYGLSVYDHILLNGSVAKDGEVLY